MAKGRGANFGRTLRRTALSSRAAVELDRRKAKDVLEKGKAAPQISPRLMRQAPERGRVKCASSRDRPGRIPNQQAPVVRKARPPLDLHVPPPGTLSGDRREVNGRALPLPQHEGPA